MANSSSVILGRVFLVQNICGLHAAPCGRLIRTAEKFQCEMFVSTKALQDFSEINKNAEPFIHPLEEAPEWCTAGMGNLLWLGGPKGSSIELGLRGEQAMPCFEEFEKLFSEGFARIDRNLRPWRF